MCSPVFWGGSVDLLRDSPPYEGFCQPSRHLRSFAQRLGCEKMGKEPNNFARVEEYYAMIELPPPFRLAVPDDAPAVAEFFNMANDGLGRVLWQLTCEPGDTPEQVGLRAMSGRINDGDVVVTDDPGGALAGLISHAQPRHADPLPDHMPAALHVIHALRQQAPETWFITSVAVRPTAQGQGLGKTLLGLAEDMARDAGLSATSLLVLEHNAGARRLYEKLGYSETARDRIEQSGWAPSPKEISLMIKRI
jgi:ribosomal protein S18 acetylase RimI-like enzyme